MRKHTTLLLLCLLLLSACGETAYHRQIELLYRHSVPTVSPDSLYSLLQHADTVLLLDVRSPKEWQVSHLPQAQFAGFENFSLTSLQKLDRNTPIVLYCTIGYRSEQIGEQLQEAGFTRVSHLYGGMLEWSNQEYPLLNRQGFATDSLHAYDRYWGTFLNKGTAVYE